MAEYIERDIMLAKFIEGDGSDDFTTGYNFAVNEYKNKLKAMPAADVQSVKHGKWLSKIEGDIYDFSECSECGNMESCETPYCAQCGARMDGDAE